MKNLKALTLGIASLGLLIAACDNSTDGGGDPVSKSALIGKWIINRIATHGSTTMTMPGEPVQQYPVNEDTNYTGSEFFIQFNSDDTYTANTPQDTSTDTTFVLKRAAKVAAGPSESGTWAVSGSTVTLTDPYDSTTIPLTVVLNGNKAQFTFALNESDSIPVFDSTGAIVATGTLKINISSTSYTTKQ